VELILQVLWWLASQLVLCIAAIGANSSSWLQMPLLGMQVMLGVGIWSIISLLISCSSVAGLQPAPVDSMVKLLLFLNGAIPLGNDLGTLGLWLLSSGVSGAFGYWRSLETPPTVQKRQSPNQAPTVSAGCLCARW